MITRVFFNLKAFFSSFDLREIIQIILKIMYHHFSTMELQRFCSLIFYVLLYLFSTFSKYSFFKCKKNKFIFKQFMWTFLYFFLILWGGVDNHHHVIYWAGIVKYYFTYHVYETHFVQNLTIIIFINEVKKCPKTIKKDPKYWQYIILFVLTILLICLRNFLFFIFLKVCVNYIVLKFFV